MKKYVSKFKKILSDLKVNFIKYINLVKSDRDVRENLVSFAISLAVFTVLLFSIKYVYNYLNLPKQDELIIIVKSFFETYGLWVILVAAFIEALLFFGWYFPGSLVIFLGVASQIGNPAGAMKAVLFTTIGMTAGYFVNYILGKYGWYRILAKYGLDIHIKSIEAKVDKNGIYAIWFLYMQPGFGALTSTVLGILKFNLIRFFIITISLVILWNIFWGTLVYFMGMTLFNALTSYIGIAILAIAFFGYLYINKNEVKI